MFSPTLGQRHDTMMTAVSLTKILRFQDSYNAISSMLNQQNFNFVLKSYTKKELQFRSSFRDHFLEFHLRTWTRLVIKVPTP